MERSTCISRDAPRGCKESRGTGRGEILEQFEEGAAMGASGSTHTSVGDARVQTGFGNKECEMIKPDTEVEVEWGVAMVLA